jgi:hypothetical protein
MAELATRLRQASTAAALAGMWRFAAELSTSATDPVARETEILERELASRRVGTVPEAAVLPLTDASAITSQSMQIERNLDRAGLAPIARLSDRRW